MPWLQGPTYGGYVITVGIKLNYQEYGVTVLVQLQKKGTSKNYDSWRSISLLCFPNNVLNRVTWRRVRDCAKSILREVQALAVMGLNQINALIYNFEQTTVHGRLVLVFVALQKAVDLVNTSKVCNTVTGNGTS